MDRIKLCAADAAIHHHAKRCGEAGICGGQRQAGLFRAPCRAACKIGIAQLRILDPKLWQVFECAEIAQRSKRIALTFAANHLAQRQLKRTIGIADYIDRRTAQRNFADREHLCRIERRDHLKAQTKNRHSDDLCPCRIRKHHFTQFETAQPVIRTEINLRIRRADMPAGGRLGDHAIQQLLRNRGIDRAGQQTQRKHEADRDKGRKKARHAPQSDFDDAAYRPNQLSSSECRVD